MIKIAQMPLYWRFKDEVSQGTDNPPARAPFIFDFDPELNLLIEKRSDALTSLLSNIYSRYANVGFLQDGHSLINTYGADFWRFLTELLRDFPADNVLEIGCGGCVLLERLRDAGHSVSGIDPSPFAAQAGEEKGIKVIQEFFPTAKLDAKPDLIFQVDVLEHIEDPVAFIRAQSEHLGENGMVVVNVPDCSLSIELGDISMALHQHVNMFDKASLARVFETAGMEVLRLEKSRYGSALYCAARKSESGKNEPVVTRNAVDCWQNFQAKAQRSIARFQSQVNTARKKSESIGFFMPQRAFPYLGTIDWFEDFRVFDNMNVWHRRYLDGLDIPIENQRDLIDKPVDHLFVMSLTFGREVASQVREAVPDMKVATLEEIIA